MRSTATGSGRVGGVGAAVALGQLVAGGALTTEQVTSVLEHAGHQVGQTPREIPRTIASGLTAGAKRPRQVTS
jgi:hypothetical protein